MNDFEYYEQVREKIFEEILLMEKILCLWNKFIIKWRNYENACLYKKYQNTMLF
jgi:hypothetical protein